MLLQSWLIRRFAPFVIVSIPFLVFYCYAGDRNRAAISFAFTIWGTAFGFFTFLAQAQTKRLEKSESFADKILSDPELKTGISIAARLGRIGEAPAEGSPEYKSLLNLLNFLERMCGAMMIDAADESALREQMFDIVLKVFRSSEPFINQDRMKTAQPGLYGALQETAEKWEKSGYR
jgi:Domain of unknown function (DUF4760)